MPQTALAGEANTSPVTVNMGWQPTMNGARFFVAQAKNLFEKEGIELNLIKFTAGPPFFAAFQSGSIDVGFLGFQPAATAIAQGIAVQVIAVENDSGGSEGLVVRSDSGIETLADMRGKTIATKRGSSGDTALHMGLREAGLEPGDVNIVDLDVTSLLPAFSKGDVDGGWYWEPWMGLLKRQGGEVIAVDRDVDTPVGIVWLARSDWINDNPEAVQRLLRVIDLATGPLHQDPKSVAPEIANRLGLEEEHVLEVITEEGEWPTLAEQFDKSYPYSMNPDVIDANKGIAGAMTENAQFQESFGIIESVPDYAEAVATKPLATYLNAKQ
jgi:aliphatic sulfonates family ABC transporter substrate-binding protein